MRSAARMCSRHSIEAIRRLNIFGYGVEGSGLELTLVYNSLGSTLPPTQEALENAYHHELQARYGVVFNSLFTITNSPINRFRDQLARDGEHDKYMDTLVAAFNPAAAERAHVPQNDLGRLAWTTLRLRFQPGVGPRPAAGPANQYPRLQLENAPPPPHNPRPALLRLHGRHRVELPGRGIDVRGEDRG